jgi:hypothetical protein
MPLMVDQIKQKNYSYVELSEIIDLACSEYGFTEDEKECLMRLISPRFTEYSKNWPDKALSDIETFFSLSAINRGLSVELCQYIYPLVFNIKANLLDTETPEAEDAKLEAIEPVSVKETFSPTISPRIKQIIHAGRKYTYGYGEGQIFVFNGEKYMVTNGMSRPIGLYRGDEG